MPLVEYESDSSDDECARTELESSGSMKRKAEESASPELPALPESFHDLYATSARSGVKDDPSLHAGRKRTMPHVDGVWPSHVYIEWRPEERSAVLLQSTLTKLKLSDSTGDSIQPLLTSALGADAPLHVSLSRTLGLKSDQRDAFIERLTRCVRKGNVKRFSAKPTALKWVPNFEGNRWFLILQLDRPKDDWFRILLAICNEVATEFHQPMLYQNSPISQSPASKRAKFESGRADELLDAPSSPDDPFHISIAWSLKAPSVSTLSQTVAAWNDELGALRVPVSLIKVKLGNSIRSLKLAEDAESDKQAMEQ